MNDTDTYKVGMACGYWCDKFPHDFYFNLAEEMVNDNYEINGPTTRRGGSRRAEAPLTSPPIAYAAPIKRNINKNDGTESNYTDQGHCTECKKCKPTTFCIIYSMQKPTGKYCICTLKTGWLWLEKHFDRHHSLEQPFNKLINSSFHCIFLSFYILYIT